MEIKKKITIIESEWVYPVGENLKKNEFSPRGVVVKVLHCGPDVSEFELQLRYYDHFWTNTLGQSK